MRHWQKLVKYILFLRLVRQNYVSIEDNRFAQILINSFVEQFPNLYGTKNVTHNIHTSLHIPTQIAELVIAELVIAELVKYKNIIELNEDTKSIIDTLDRFFLICKISDFDFIKIEDLISKCVLLQHNDEYFISIFNETDEIID